MAYLHNGGTVRRNVSATCGACATIEWMGRQHVSKRYESRLHQRGKKLVPRIFMGFVIPSGGKDVWLTCSHVLRVRQVEKQKRTLAWNQITGRSFGA